MKSVKHLLTLFTLVFFSTFCFAQDETATDISPFEINYMRDGSIILFSSALAFIPLLVENEIPYSEENVRDKSKVNTLDRSLINKGDNQTMATLSDIGAVAVPISAYALTFLYNKENSKNEILEDWVIMSESVLVSAAVYQIVSHSFQRPRPYMYTEEKKGARGNNWDFRSFYSGHTANVTAIATSIAYIHSKRYPNSSYKPLIWLTALTGSAAVGATRILSGNHFYTDVAMGTLSGLSIGLLVPMLHEKSKNSRYSITARIDGAAINYTF